MSETLNSKIISLSHLGLIYVSGDDALKFLNGQSTVDFNATNPDNLLPGAVCTPKGRVIANFLTTAFKDGFLLILPREQIDVLITNLKKYSVFFKTGIEDISNNWVIMGNISQDPLIKEDELISFRWNTERQLILQNSKSDTTDEQQRYFGNSSQLIDSRQWQLLDIQQGLPWILKETTEQYIPQNINLQWLDGISFKKGCYTGQEIVTRMHHKGKLKNYVQIVQSESSMTIGQKLFDSAGKSVGQVLNVVDNWALIVVLHKAIADGVFCNTDSKLKLKFLTLPYSNKIQ